MNALSSPNALTQAELLNEVQNPVFIAKVGMSAMRLLVDEQGRSFSSRNKGKETAFAIGKKNDRLVYTDLLMPETEIENAGLDPAKALELSNFLKQSFKGPLAYSLALFLHSHPGQPGPSAPVTCPSEADLKFFLMTNRDVPGHVGGIIAHNSGVLSFDSILLYKASDELDEGGLLNEKVLREYGPERRIQAMEAAGLLTCTLVRFSDSFEMRGLQNIARLFPEPNLTSPDS